MCIYRISEEGVIMREFKTFVDKTFIDFKKIVTSGSCSDRYKNNVNSFLSYVSGDFEDKYKRCEKEVNGFTNVVLENVVDVKYRFLFKNQDLKSCRDFINTFVSRMKDFSGNENSMKILVGFYLLYFVVVVKLVDIYMESVLAYAGMGKDTSTLTLSDMGIDNDILKFYKLFENLREKSIDDWIGISPNAGEEKYMSSAVKRILLIFGY